MPTTYAIPNGRTVMDATTYTGTGGTTSFTNNDLGTVGFKPDLVWIKGVSNTGSHSLQDSVRGAGSATKLSTNSTNAQNNASGDATDPIYGYLSAFNSNGFTVVNGSTGGQTNVSGVSFVAWQWQAGQGTTTTNNVGSISSQVSTNTTAGFSVVTYTGNGTLSTVGHGLGSSPQFIIVKDRTATNPWACYHVSLGVQYYTLLNATDASYNNLANYWSSTAPSSTVFGINSYGGVNSSGDGYVAYCWSAVPGFSQFGSYIGNNSSDGPFIYLGFRPKFVMIKCAIGSNQDWIIWDSTRSPYNVAQKRLRPNLSNAEVSGDNYDYMDILSNGFKLRGQAGSNGTNGSGYTYIYAAFAENPFKNANAR